LALVPYDAGSMLMHADNGGIDHLDGIMGSGKCVYDALRAEADINVPTTLAKSVENDLKQTRLRRLPILAALAYCALDRWIMV
jgi:hypothetical protein